MFRVRRACAVIGTRFRLHPTTQYCSSSSKTNNTRKETNVSAYDESYRQLDNLDFPTAAKILFSDSPKKKKFGLDFHLVQLFFACMPSFGISADEPLHELEEKKKKEDEEKQKETELKEAEEQAKRESDPVLLKVKERLDQLEETVKEIVADSRKQSDDAISKSQQGDAEAVEAKGTTKSSSTGKQKPTEQVVGSGQDRGKVTSVSDSSVEDKKYNNQKEEPSKEIKK